MANYVYETLTGPVEIEVDEQWSALLKVEDEKEENAGRKHTRADHKYAPGEPVSIESLQFEGEWLTDRNDGIGDAELSMDLEYALQSLTELQRRYFIMTRLEGYSYAEIARRENKHKSTVKRLTEAAAEKLKKFF